MLSITSSDSANMTMNGLVANGLSLSNGIAVLMLGKINNAEIDGIVFENVHPANALDTSNYLISMEDFAASGTSSVTFSNLNVQN